MTSAALQQEAPPSPHTRSSWLFSAPMRRAAEALQLFSLGLMLLLLPFSKAVIEVTSVLLLIGWVWLRLDPVTRWDTVWARPAQRPLAAGLFAFFVVCGLSILISDYPDKSINAWINKWGQYLMLMVCAADVGRRATWTRRALVVMACSAAVVAFEAMWQERTGHGLLHHYRLIDYGRMVGPYENPIDLATYLMVIIPILSADAARRRWPARIAISLLVAVLLLCLGRTRALGAWLGLSVALVITALRSPALRRVVVGLLVLNGLAWGICARGAANLPQAMSLSDIGTSDRVAMWRAAIGMIRDRPLLGHGLNTFMANYLRYWVAGERQPRYAHNCYLQVAAETGLLGLITFVAVLASLFPRLLAGTRRIDPQDSARLLGFFAGLVAFVLQAGIDTNFYSLRQAALFWTLGGLALGLANSQEPNPSASAAR